MSVFLPVSVTFYLCYFGKDSKLCVRTKKLGTTRFAQKTVYKMDVLTASIFKRADVKVVQAK